MIAAIKKRSGWLLASMILLSATVYGIWLAPMVERWVVERSRDAGFVLTDLQIDGIVRSKRANVLAALDVDNGVPLLTIDLELVRKQLELLPWVREAKVSRVLPGGLQIQLTEREPFALWQKEGKVSLIDAEGVVITQRGLANYAQLMMVVGEGANAEIGALHQLLDQEPALADDVRTAVWVGERRWDLIFENGIRVKLPEPHLADYNAVAAWTKLAALEAEYHLLGREVDVIDMRLPDRLIFRVSPEGRRRMNGTGWAT